MKLYNCLSGEVIFEREVNSIKELVEEAVKLRVCLNYAELNNAKLNNAKLDYAELNYAELDYAELNNAKLNYAKLNYAELYNAELNSAELNSAELNNAELYNAELYNAKLNNAKLNNAELYNTNLNNAELNNVELHNVELHNVKGNMKEIKNISVDKYHIVFTENILAIGCKTFSYEEWENFKDDEIATLDKGALEWWRKWKDFIFKAVELSNIRKEIK